MPLAGYLDSFRNDIRRMIEDELQTQAQVAKTLGVNKTSVERACKRWGLKTQRTGPRGREGHPKWRGGRYQMGLYWYVRADDHPNCTKAGYVAEHRLVMETKLNRLLERGEVVHHMDGNAGNNHPDNLMVFPRNSDHLRHELTGRVPNWTPDGLARMQVGVQKSATIRRKSRPDDGQRIQSNAHPPSSIGSNDEPLAS